MSDDPFAESSAPQAESAAPRRRRRWPWAVLAAVLLVPAAVMAIWVAFALNWTYSRGDRVGFVLKFSEKGWLCKTWEGELSMSTVPGVTPEKWLFTVRDDAVARRIQALQGQHVALDYEEHKFLPTSCFGDTDYFVTEVRPIQSTLPVTPGFDPRGYPATPVQP